MSDDLKLLLDEIHDAIESRRKRLRSNLIPAADTEIAAINNGAINDAIAEGKYISAVVTSAFEKRLFPSNKDNA